MHDHESRGRILVAIAREAIVDRTRLVPLHGHDAPWLRERAATFVTLKAEGELRGCIGSLEAVRALEVDVAENARAAAYRDPRFPPVDPSEWQLLEVEVSVLTARVPLEVESESQALAQLRPGIDGLVLEFGEARATFLPQVWEGLPEPLVFLSELRRKANLPPRFWHPQIRLSRYTVDKYR